GLLTMFRQKGFFDVQVDVDTKAQPDGIIITYSVRKGNRKKIEDVTFTGNGHLAEDELEQHVNVRKAGFLSKGSYDVNSVKTLQAFYHSKGFNQVKVTPQFDTKEGDVILRFVVDEGPQDTVEAFRLEGNNSVPLSQLAADGLRSAPDQPYA